MELLVVRNAAEIYTIGHILIFLMCAALGCKMSGATKKDFLLEYSKVHIWGVGERMRSLHAHSKHDIRLNHWPSFKTRTN